MAGRQLSVHCVSACEKVCLRAEDPREIGRCVPGLGPDETATLGGVERLMQGGNIESAVDILANVVEQGASVQATCLLASLYLELGQNDIAHRYASMAV